jgi:hypothetical protein
MTTAFLTQGLAVGSLAVLLCFGPRPALAYEIGRTTGYGAPIKVEKMPIRFNIRRPSILGATAEQAQGAIRAAYRHWTSVPCADLATEDLGFTEHEYEPEDGINTHAFGELPPGADGFGIAITLSLVNPVSGELLHSDTIYSDKVFWTTTGEPAALGIEYIATHEIGHSLGLDHNHDPSSIMFPSINTGTQTSFTRLSDDDKANLCHLYGEDGLSCGGCSASGAVARGGAGAGTMAWPLAALLFLVSRRRSQST